MTIPCEALCACDHAEQPKLIEGMMGEHISSMVIARAADIWVEDRQAVRAARSAGADAEL